MTQAAQGCAALARWSRTRSRAMRHAPALPRLPSGASAPACGRPPPRRASAAAEQTCARAADSVLRGRRYARVIPSAPELAMSPSPARPRAKSPPKRSAAATPAPRTRVEHDSMGELQVPADALWGAQTQRAVQNFPVSGRPMPRGFMRALGLVKAAAAEVNAGLGLLPKNVSAAIRAAALEVAGGRHDAHFPVDIYQTGSGTSSN